MILQQDNLKVPILMILKLNQRNIITKRYKVRIAKLRKRLKWRRRNSNNEREDRRLVARVLHAHLLEKCQLLQMQHKEGGIDYWQFSHFYKERLMKINSK